MFQIDNTVISDLLTEKKFVCDLSKCKGACCIHGDSGAPLEEHEADKIEAYYSEIKKYMLPEGIKAVENFGFHYVDAEHDLVTMLVGDEACAYVTYDENKTALCAIEKAYLAGDIPFRKPISCFLYPVRTKKIAEFEAVNYDEWDICKDAVVKGEETNTPVYEFLKIPLTEKFGADWYEQLDFFAKNYQKNKG